MIITYKQIAEVLTNIVYIDGLEVDDIEELIDALADSDGEVEVIDKEE